MYILHGGTNSQREHYIYNHAADGALILSVPRLQKALSPRQPRGRVFSVVWQARDLVLAAIEKRFGQWTEAWVVGEFINMGEREALARRLGAACIDVAENKAEAEKLEEKAEEISEKSEDEESTEEDSEEEAQQDTDDESETKSQAVSTPEEMNSSEKEENSEEGIEAK